MQTIATKQFTTVPEGMKPLIFGSANRIIYPSRDVEIKTTKVFTHIPSHRNAHANYLEDWCTIWEQVFFRDLGFLSDTRSQQHPSNILKEKVEVIDALFRLIADATLK